MYLCQIVEIEDVNSFYKREFLGLLTFCFQLVRTNAAKKVVKNSDLNIIRRTESRSIFCVKDVM